MNEVLTWGAIVASAGSIAVVIKFWIDMGRSVEKADQAISSAAMMAAKADLISSALADFKVHSAQTYATTRALGETEAALAASVERSVQGIYTRLDRMTERLDSLITIAVGKVPPK